MNKLLIFGFLILFFSCKPEKIDIPSRVEVSDLTKKIRVGKTRIVINNNPEYKFIPELIRLQKSTTQYLQFVEIPNQDFSTALFKILPRLESNDVKKPILKKELQLGEYNAFIMTSMKEGLEQAILLFGDKSFSVMVIGVYPPEKNTREEIFGLMLSAYLNKDISVDLQRQLNFDVDLCNSNYLLSTVNSTVGVYSENGVSITSDDWRKNYFLVSIIPQGQNFDLEEFNEKMTKKLGQNSFEDNRIETKITNTKIQDNVIETELLGDNLNNKLLIYQYVKSTSKGVIYFVGYAFESKEEQIKRFKEIAKTIK